jgi:hypothetical protein
MLGKYLVGKLAFQAAEKSVYTWEILKVGVMVAIWVSMMVY